MTTPFDCSRHVCVELLLGVDPGVGSGEGTLTVYEIVMFSPASDEERGSEGQAEQTCIIT